MNYNAEKNVLEADGQLRFLGGAGKKPAKIINAVQYS
jgi:hypothetical protein